MRGDPGFAAGLPAAGLPAGRAAVLHGVDCPAPRGDRAWPARARRARERPRRRRATSSATSWTGISPPAGVTAWSPASPRAQRLPAPRPRQVHLPQLRPRAGLPGRLPPPLRRHQPHHGGPGVRAVDPGATCAGWASTGRTSSSSPPTTTSGSTSTRSPSSARGKAYVCSLSEEEIRKYRGTAFEPGVPSPYRGRSVEENLDLFAPHAQRRVRRRRPRAARQDRHGEPQPQDARLAALPHPPRAPLPQPATPGASTPSTTSPTASPT